MVFWKHHVQEMEPQLLKDGEHKRIFSSCFLAGLSRRKGKAAVMDDKINFTQHGISR
jgi:hypothetical protein